MQLPKRRKEEEGEEENGRRKRKKKKKEERKETENQRKDDGLLGNGWGSEGEDAKKGERGVRPLRLKNQAVFFFFFLVKIRKNKKRRQRHRRVASYTESRVVSVVAVRGWNGKAGANFLVGPGYRTCEASQHFKSLPPGMMQRSLSGIVRG